MFPFDFRLVWPFGGSNSYTIFYQLGVSVALIRTIPKNKMKKKKKRKKTHTFDKK